MPVGTAVMEIDDGTGAGTAGDGAAAAARRVRSAGSDAAPSCRRPSDPPTPPLAAGSRRSRGRRPHPPRAGAGVAAVPDRGPAVADPVSDRAAAGARSAASTSPPSPASGEGGRITKADVLAASPAEPLPRRRRRAWSCRPRPLRAPRWPRCRRRRRCRRARARTSSRCRTSARRSPRTCWRRCNQTARAWTMVEVNVERLVRLRDGRQGRVPARSTA